MALFTTNIGYTGTTLESVRSIITTTSQNQGTKQRVIPGQIYQFSLDFRDMTQTELNRVVSFFEVNAGNIFEIIHPNHAQLLGELLGAAPRIAGGAQTGNSVTIDGLVPSSTGVFLIGDVISFTNNTKVYKVTADVDASVSGTATIPIFPPLVQSPADNSFVNYTGVEFSVILTDDTVSSSTDFNNVSSFSINLKEAI